MVFRDSSLSLLREHISYLVWSFLIFHCLPSLGYELLSCKNEFLTFRVLNVETVLTITFSPPCIFYALRGLELSITRVSTLALAFINKLCFDYEGQLQLCQCLLLTMSAGETEKYLPSQR